MNLKQIELIATIAAVEKIAEMAKLPTETIFAAYMTEEPHLSELINELVDQAVELATLTEHLANHAGKDLVSTLHGYTDAAPDVKSALEKMRVDRAATLN